MLSGAGKSGVLVHSGCWAWAGCRHSSNERRSLPAGGQAQGDTGSSDPGGAVEDEAHLLGEKGHQGPFHLGSSKQTPHSRVISVSSSDFVPSVLCSHPLPLLDC